MSAAPPILILQMQRMGDMILSFPLALWLLRKFPGHPIWMMGEKNFYQGLLPVAPEITFFPTEALRRLHGRSFHLVLNLSHRPEAAALRQHINCEAWLGPYISPEGEMHITGDWQLYRASLTHNNRHNLFHWADLNALDIIPYKQWSGTGWQQAAPVRARGDRVGLFLGASEADKRPEAAFWAELTRRLLKLGLRPVLLGGKMERALGHEVARLAGAPALNLCGRFDLPGLVAFMDNLRLLVTPDTGPMHLAAWLSLPVLNLSLGPVNAWETGPYQPGHLILRSTVSCEGCWQCAKPQVFCRESFSAPRTASLIKTMVEHESQDPSGGPGNAPDMSRIGRLVLPGQEIFTTSRYRGLYDLVAPGHTNPPEATAPECAQRPRLALDRFWQAFFAHSLGLWGKAPLLAARDNLQQILPQLNPPMHKALSNLQAELARGLKQRPTPLEENFWQKFPPLLRPLTGYLHMLLQNDNYSLKAYATALELVDALRDVTNV